MKRILAILFTLIAVNVSALQYIPESIAGYMDGSGSILENGYVAFYSTSALSSFKAVYSDYAGTTTVSQSGNGIQLNASGQPTSGGNATVLFGDGTYWIRLKDEDGITVATFESINYSEPASSSDIPWINVANVYGTDDSDIQSAIAAYTDTSTEVTFLMDDDFTISSSQEFLSHIRLLFVNGATLTVESGNTLTISSNDLVFENSSYISNAGTVVFSTPNVICDPGFQVFQGAGTYSGELANKDLTDDIFGTVDSVIYLSQWRSTNLVSAIAYANANSSIDFTLVIDNDSTLASSVSFPTNIKKLKFTSGSLITGNYTLTHTGQYINAPDNQIIYGSDVTITGNISNNEFHPEWLGAIRDDGLSDITAINKACTFYRGTIAFGLAKYDIDATIQLQRGNKLLGTGMNDTTATASSQIFLMDGSDCSLVNLPFSRGESATHYMGIENIYFDANGDNQTTENYGINFSGAYVMSWIRNVFINDNRGTALLLANNSDVEVDHLWIEGTIIASTANYAIEINPTLNSGQSGLISMDNIYIENVKNTPTGNPRDNPEDRGNGMLVNRVVKGNFENMHFEGCLNVIDLSVNHSVNFESISGTHLGYTSVAYDGFFRFMDATTRAFTLTSFEMGDTDGDFNLLLLNSGVTNNDMKPIGDIAYLSQYIYGDRTNAIVFTANNPIITNSLKIIENGAFTPQNLTFQADQDVTTQNHYIKAESGELTIGSDYDQADGSYQNDFILIDSNGNKGDRVVFYEPIVLAERPDNANTLEGTLYYTSLTATHNILRFERVDATGAQNETMIVPLVWTGTATPNITPYAVGHIFVDETNDNAFISIGTSSSSDWKKITP